MSAMLTMLPSSAMKAMLSGSSVFFIQKQRLAGASKTNSMPSCVAISRAEHHAGLRLLRRARHLGADVVHAGLQRDACRSRGCGLGLRRGAAG